MASGVNRAPPTGAGAAGCRCSCPSSRAWATAGASAAAAPPTGGAGCRCICCAMGLDCAWEAPGVSAGWPSAPDGEGAAPVTAWLCVAPVAPGSAAAAAAAPAAGLAAAVGWLAAPVGWLAWLAAPPVEGGAASAASAAPWTTAAAVLVSRGSGLRTSPPLLLLPVPLRLGVKKAAVADGAGWAPCPPGPSGASDPCCAGPRPCWVVGPRGRGGGGFWSCCWEGGWATSTADVWSAACFGTASEAAAALA